MQGILGATNAGFGIAGPVSATGDAVPPHGGKGVPFSLEGEAPPVPARGPATLTVEAVPEDEMADSADSQSSGHDSWDAEDGVLLTVSQDVRLVPPHRPDAGLVRAAGAPGVPRAFGDGALPSQFISAPETGTSVSPAIPGPAVGQISPEKVNRAGGAAIPVAPRLDATGAVSAAAEKDIPVPDDKTGRQINSAVDMVRRDAEGAGLANLGHAEERIPVARQPEPAAGAGGSLAPGVDIGEVRDARKTGRGTVALDGIAERTTNREGAPASAPRFSDAAGRTAGQPVDPRAGLVGTAGDGKPGDALRSDDPPGRTSVKTTEQAAPAGVTVSPAAIERSASDPTPDRPRRDRLRVSAAPGDTHSGDRGKNQTVPDLATGAAVRATPPLMFAEAPFALPTDTPFFQPDGIAAFRGEVGDGLMFGPPDRADHVRHLHGIETRPVPMARAVVAQISDAVSFPMDGSVELRLSPEELGRVKVSMTPGEGGLVVQLVVERQETLDLLRRHVDMLAEDLGRAGYSGLEFTFSNEGGERPGGDGPAAGPADASASDSLATLPERGTRTATLTPAGRLDIRL